MPSKNVKPVIGLLGGIGSGKSSAAKILGEMGCAVIDADALAHNQLENPQTKQKIREIFGPEVMDSAGNVDRKALGKVVFDSLQAVEKLNSLIHPAVMARTDELIKKYQVQPDVKAVILDIPLLVEVGQHKCCDKLVFIASEEKNRMARLAQKAGFNKEQIKKREFFQISLDKKAEISDYIVQNNSNLDELAKQLRDVLSAVIRDM